MQSQIESTAKQTVNKQTSEIQPTDHETMISDLPDSFDNVSLPNKKMIFKKQTLRSQGNFNVSFASSLFLESDLESQEVSKSNLNPFRNSETPIDPFNMFSNETNFINEESNSIDIEVTDTILNKKVSDVFNKAKDLQNNSFSVSYDQTKNVSNSELGSARKNMVFKSPRRSMSNFQISYNESRDQTLTKDNLLSQQKLFKLDLTNSKKQGELPNDVFQVEFNESETVSDSKLTKLAKSPSLNNSLNCNVLKENNSFNIANKMEAVLRESAQHSETGNTEELNKSLNRKITSLKNSREGFDKVHINESIEKINLSNKHENSNLYLDQSSFNDDNLKNWMSDYSEEEMIPPKIAAPVSSNSFEKETGMLKPVEGDNDIPESWEEKFNTIVSNANKLKVSIPVFEKNNKMDDVLKKKNINKQKVEGKQSKPPKIIKPSPFVTKRLLCFIIDKMKPKFGIDSVIEAEKLISLLCETVKIVNRRKTYQKKLIMNLKKAMALAGVINTTVDFYEFIIKFLPFNFRVKVIPCLNPVTNTIYPPRDVINPFDKIE